MRSTSFDEELLESILIFEIVLRSIQPLLVSFIVLNLNGSTLAHLL